MPDIFASGVYVLCLLTSACCALLLARSYRRTGARLLLWSSLCFMFLAANNFVLVTDVLIFPDNDLRLIRLGFSLAAVGVLLFGFIWDLEE